MKRDTEPISNLVRKNFNVIRQYNTEEKLEDNQFGYSSIHQIIELPEEWLKIPTLKGCKGIKSEIQIRTLSQHAWAEASNIFQYKSEDNVPKPLKRSISRISALLETVDLEFERILDERNNYQGVINTEISLQEKLNVDLLSQILNDRLPQKNKRANEEYSELLMNLNEFNIADTTTLNSLINKHMKSSLEAEERICKEMLINFAKKNELISNDSYSAMHYDLNNIKNGIFFTHAGLIRHMLNQELGRNWFDILREREKRSIKES